MQPAIVVDDVWKKFRLYDERNQSLKAAVMAATGLLYLAILTGFGMDLLPRALLS